MDYEPLHDLTVRLNNQRTSELYCLALCRGLTPDRLVNFDKTLTFTFL